MSQSVTALTAPAAPELPSLALRDNWWVLIPVTALIVAIQSHVLGLPQAADQVRRAVDRAAVGGALGLRSNGTVASTRAAGRGVIDALR